MPLYESKATGTKTFSANFTKTWIFVNNDRITRLFTFSIFFPDYIPFEANKTQWADFITRGRSQDKKYFVKFILSGRIGENPRFLEKWK